MSFDPSKYQAPQSKSLPVILLLDVSGSMKTDGKIKKLQEATEAMIRTFSALVLKETAISVAIITFGGDQVKLHTPLTKAEQLQIDGIQNLVAGGSTPMGMAFQMAKDMIEDRKVIKQKSYRPAIVVVSDGQPTDDWESPLKCFIDCGRSSKCQRFAVAIGENRGVDVAMLREFTKNAGFVLTAKDAGEIAEKFEEITMTVSVRSKSVDPNVFSIVNDLPVSGVDDEDDIF